MWQQLLKEIQDGNIKSLARSISLVENETAGYEELMQSLPHTHPAKIIGITGPPGAGKSTLTDALIGTLIKEEKKIGVLCVDPSSPFNFGSLLGDRIRMSEWYNNPNVFIRSLATRGSLGGLHPKIFEITDIMIAAGFDYIIIETVGVGQSEVEIAGLADVTVVVLVPEGGDVIQTMKAGLMEIADIFVVNKSDRPDADIFVNNLKMMLAPAFKNTAEIPIVKTVASEKKGVEELFTVIIKKLQEVNNSDKKYILLAEKAFYIIQKRRMKDVNKQDLLEKIKSNNVTNIYSLLQHF
ncbi:MAG: meaB [Chitinophagaceae bacterium]|nr:meaB [Chitinophagaceae bacterium]